MYRTIIHIDGDSFFASCQVALEPSLKGKAVVTGHERGIASAMSAEAKKLGITRGMPVFKIKEMFPEVVIRASDYQLYSVFAERMYAIVRRYTPLVEEYSIDECFADITDLDKVSGTSSFEIARSIKETLKRELGVTFSVGIGPTKCLAKVASKFEKPDGLTEITGERIPYFLKEIFIGKIWGIGPSTSQLLQGHGVKTALDFIEKPREWIREYLSEPHQEIWEELRGVSVKRVHAEVDDSYGSIQQTRTFTPATTNRSFIHSQLSRNVEGACAKARRHGFVSKRIYFFLKTQEFRYHRMEIPLLNPIIAPNEVMHEINKYFDDVYQTGITYRATGVTLADLIPMTHVSGSLFGEPQNASWDAVFNSIDILEHKIGSRSVILAGSLNAHNDAQMKHAKTLNSEVFKNGLYKDPKYKKRLRLPHLGEAK